MTSTASYHTIFSEISYRGCLPAENPEGEHRKVNEKELIKLAYKKALAEAKGDKDEAVSMTLGFLAVQAQATKRVFLKYGFQVYKDDLWKPHPLYGNDWRKWVKHSLGKILSARERSIVTNGMPVLDYLRKHRIRVGDMIINHDTLLNRRTFFEATLPVMARLDLDSAKGQADFERMMIAAATMTRSEFRAYLRKEFGRRNPLKNLATRVQYKGNRVIVTLECPKEDLATLVKKLRGIIALPEDV
jgi:nuclear transport factor 2 (NTF2) superfamily protein